MVSTVILGPFNLGGGEIFILYLLMALANGLMGQTRSAGFLMPFLCSLAFTPLVGLIVVLASRRNAQPAEGHYTTQQHAQQVNHFHAAPPPPPQSGARPNAQEQRQRNSREENYAHLERLAELRKNGVLSEEEFLHEKSKIIWE